MGTVPCPSCGVAVAIGYPRCPKCHGVVPMARAKRQTFREEALGGGTTSEPPEQGGGSGVWIVVAVGVVAAAAAIAYMFTRGGSKPAPEASSEASGDDDVATPAALVEEQPAAASGSAAKLVATGDDGEAAKRALDGLDGQLRGDRMWATVTRDRLEVVVASSLCDQPEMKLSIANATGPLVAAGFTSLRCEEKNGHVVFEEPLP